MSELTPAVPGEPTRITAEQYLRLIETGVIEEDERVELLEGVIVAMAPPNPPHDSATARANYALVRSIGDRAVVRPQSSFRAGRWSVPQPDFAIVPGSFDDYDTVHPGAALLLVEISDSSLAQDRLSKSRIYAAAGVPEYWIVNLRRGVLEVMRTPDRAAALYRDLRTLGAGDAIELAALPGASIAVADLLPKTIPG